MDFIRGKIKNIQEEIRGIRRELHKIPEIGFQEVKTSTYIRNLLDAWQVPYEIVATTGIAVHFKGAAPQSYAFRADMDGLPTQEATGVDFASVHPGRMHACGHDGHMSIALGIIRYIKNERPTLTRGLLVLFQPAEEGPGGAWPIIETGILKKYQVTEIFGYHLYPDVEKGFFATRRGPMMAGTGELDIEITGRSAHGGQPHQGKDAVLLGARLVGDLQSIVSRSIDPLEPAVVTLGRFSAGEARSIIAEKALLQGTVRTFSETVYKQIKGRVQQLARGLEEEGVRVEVTFRDMYPALINHNRLVEDLSAALGERMIELSAPVMLAEDFAYYTRELPGIFVFLGVKEPREVRHEPLHSARFDFDESVLGTGVEGYVRYLEYQGVLHE
ncbi:MAG: hypothetical protein AVO33_08630 [delta proteobacterium ML8_F1]|nr:MAG: hypothetical protein AVO33_08630 [delta proteobacterium ML8_F1]